MQKHVNIVDLVKSFPTNIFLQNLASIQQRTSPLKFDHLAEKSEKGSISNLSTKVDSLPVGLEHLDVRPSGKATRPLGDLATPVRMLAHEICERFDNLCDALRSSSTKLRRL